MEFRDDIEQERQHVLARLGDIEELKERYVLGKPGAWEPLDRLHIQLETFDFAILQHPFVVMSKPLYHRVSQLQEQMRDLYEHFANIINS